MDDSCILQKIFILFLFEFFCYYNNPYIFSQLAIMLQTKDIQARFHNTVVIAVPLLRHRLKDVMFLQPVLIIDMLILPTLV